MGFGMSAGLAAGLTFPEPEIWTLSGDGGTTMTIQDLVAQHEQGLGIINVVFTNKSLGFIEAEQDDTKQPHSGIELSDVDFAKVAQGFAIKGYTAHTGAEFAAILEEVKGTKVPVLIDVKITNDHLMPVEKLLNAAGARELLKDYDAAELTPIKELLAKHQA